VGAEQLAALEDLQLGGYGQPAGEARVQQDRLELADAVDAVQLRDLRADLLAVALAQAAHHIDPPARILLLELHGLGDGIDALGLGLVDEPAGVDDDQRRPPRRSPPCGRGP
jgi:hypothetical protein